MVGGARRLAYVAALVVGGGCTTEAATAVPCEPRAPSTLPLPAPPPPVRYPAPHHPLPELNPRSGLVLAEPHVITVTFAGDTERERYRAFDEMLTKSRWWGAVTEGYGIGSPVMEAPFEAAAGWETSALDSEKDLKPWIRAWAAAQSFPVSQDTLLLIHLPKEVTMTHAGSTLCAGIYGFHDFVRDPVSRVIAYAVVPRCRLGGFSLAMSHEVAEALTNPTFSSYFMFHDAWNRPGGGEAADACAREEPWLEGGFELSRAWSNDAVRRGSHPCAPSPHDQVFFGAQVDTERVLDRTKRYVSDGYVVVRAGERRDVVVRAFSERQLSSPFAIYTGVRRSLDPRDVRDPAPGLRLSMSAPRAENGDVLRMTVDAAPEVVPGDYAFAVTAVYQAQVVSLPAIVRVLPP